MTRLKAAGLAALVVTVVLAAFPATGGARPTAKVRIVTVQAGLPSEYAFVLAPKAVKRGVVTFVVSNVGLKPHDFTIRGKRTPVLAPNESARLTVTLAKPGSYPYWCTVAGHAAAGMKGSLKVT